jgi:hypothetical protein
MLKHMEKLASSNVVWKETDKSARVSALFFNDSLKWNVRTSSGNGEVDEGVDQVDD